MDCIFEVLANGINLATNALVWAMDEAYNLGGGSLLPSVLVITISAAWPLLILFP